MRYTDGLYRSEADLLYAGDVNSISIGSGTNIQDNFLFLVGKYNLSGKVTPSLENVTIGHCAVLYGCTVEDEAFFGVTLLDGAYVGKHAMGAAGALVSYEVIIPLNSRGS